MVDQKLELFLLSIVAIVGLVAITVIMRGAGGASVSAGLAIPPENLAGGASRFDQNIEPDPVDGGDPWVPEAGMKKPKCTDRDRDGYTTCDGDCDDRDAAVNPGAKDICEDGVDNDCSEGDRMCESAAFASTGDNLEIGEYLGDAKAVFTASDLPNLLTSDVVLGQQYAQTLHFAIPDTQGVARTLFAEDENDVLGDFVEVDDAYDLFVYEASFGAGVPFGNLMGGDLEILGRTFEVWNVSRWDNQAYLLLHNPDIGMVSFHDPDMNVIGDGYVEVNYENIEDADVNLVFAGSSILKLRYDLSVDATVGSNIYIPPGHGLREYLDEPEGMLSDKWDVEFGGLQEVPTGEVSITAVGEHSYDMTATNTRGKTYTWPLITHRNDIYKWGDSNDDFWFNEPIVGSPVRFYIGGDDFRISTDDYFLLSSRGSSSVLRYTGIDTSDKVLIFTDVATGETLSTGYYPPPSGNITQDLMANAQLIMDGNNYTIWVSNLAGYPIAIDLNSDYQLQGSNVAFDHRGGGQVQYKWQGINARPRFNATVHFITPSASVEEPQIDNNYEYEYSPHTVWNGKIGLRLEAHNDTTFRLINDDLNDDWERGRTTYGALHSFYNPAGSLTPQELFIDYPERQVFAEAFVVEG